MKQRKQLVLKNKTYTLDFTPHKDLTFECRISVEGYDVHLITKRAASKLRCNWRERFLSGSSPLKHARIAITPDTVLPAHAAASVEGSKKSACPGGTALCRDGKTATVPAATAVLIVILAVKLHVESATV
jgi:hypothetical protein